MSWAWATFLALATALVVTGVVDHTLWLVCGHRAAHRDNLWVAPVVGFVTFVGTLTWLLTQ